MRLPELVSGVSEREEEIIVTRNGKPAAVLVNYDEYERLKETLDVFSDANLMSQIAKTLHFYRAGKKGLSFEDVFGEPLTPTRKRRKPRLQFRNFACSAPPLKDAYDFCLDCTQ